MSLLTPLQEELLLALLGEVEIYKSGENRPDLPAFYRICDGRSISEAGLKTLRYRPEPLVRWDEQPESSSTPSQVELTEAGRAEAERVRDARAAAEDER